MQFTVFYFSARNSPNLGMSHHLEVIGAEATYIPTKTLPIVSALPEFESRPPPWKGTNPKDIPSATAAVFPEALMMM